MVQKNVYLPTGIKSLDNLFHDKGIPVGNWVGLIGEPGSYKTLTCIQIAANYILGTDDICTVFVSMEYPSQTLEQHFYQMGYDPDDIEKAITTGRLAFVDVFSRTDVANEKPESVARAIQQHAREMKEKHKGKVVVLIDGISHMWKKMPVMSRSMFGVLAMMLKNDIEMGFFTQQISIGTGDAFGWGTEHGADTIIKFGKYYKDGYKQWIYIGKHRGGNHEKRLMELLINTDKEIVVGDPIEINGRFRDVNEALESFKYSDRTGIQEDRNKLIKEQNELLERIANTLEK